MRNVIILSFLALLVASTAAFGIEPVEVGGDFGTDWFNDHQFQSETSADDTESGLWSWGNVPEGTMLDDVSLQFIYDDDDDVDYGDYTGVAWLEENAQEQPASTNGSSILQKMENISSLFTSETSADDTDSGLWSWGNAPRGMELSDRSLQSIYDDDDDVDYSGVAWLEEKI